MNKRYYELNYFNAISCLGVILIHVLSIGITSLQKDSLELFIIYMPWRIAAYVVPGFLFTGALKMSLSFDSENEDSYFKYITKRITKIYLPYCFWVVIYYVYFLKLGWVEKSLSALLKYILIGDLSAQFYYVIIVMQFYLLKPLWKYVTDKIPFYVAIPTSALITVFMNKFDGLLSYFDVNFEHKSRIFATYLLFWVMGLYFGKYYEKIKSSLIEFKKQILFLFVPIISGALLLWWQFTKNIYLYDGDNLKLFTDTLSIILLLSMCILLDNSKQKITKNTLSFICKSSFSVFLSHCLILQITTNMLQHYGITDIGVLISARLLACFTIPFLLWFIYYKLKKAIKSKVGC